MDCIISNLNITKTQTPAWKDPSNIRCRVVAMTERDGYPLLGVHKLFMCKTNPLLTTAYKQRVV